MALLVAASGPVPLPLTVSVPAIDGDIVQWVQEEDVAVGGFTNSATTGNGSTSSGDITVETGDSDGTTGSGETSLRTLATAGAPGDIFLTTGFSEGDTPPGQVLVQNDDASYSGVAGSQGFSLNATATTLDATTLVAATETVFSVLDGRTIDFPANTLQIGTSIRFRIFCTTDGAAGANATAIRARLGGLTGALIGQNLTTFDPAGATDIVILDGVFTIRTVGDITAGTIVSSCMTTSGIPGGTVAMVPYVLQSTAIDTTVAQRFVVTAEFATDANATTARLDIYEVAAYL